MYGMLGKFTHESNVLGKGQNGAKETIFSHQICQSFGFVKNFFHANLFFFQPKIKFDRNAAT